MCRGWLAFTNKNLQLICMVKVISRSFACEYRPINSTLWYELAHVHLFITTCKFGHYSAEPHLNVLCTLSLI